MGEVQQRVLKLALASWIVAGTISSLEAHKFYDDDPLWRMPAPVNVEKANRRKLSDYYDFFYMTFDKPGEKARHQDPPIPAQAVNTLGEVPDSEWYTNRHARKRMTLEELVRGVGNQHPPSESGQWRITDAKTEGVTPGFTIKDAKNRTYLIKFDSPANAELGTGADVMGAKFFYALGYNTPQNYIVYFNLEKLIVDPQTVFIDHRGVERPMLQSDVSSVLRNVPRDVRGRYRAVASLYVAGKPLGPFRYHGVRTDDPNDVVPHEHRRDLRGLKVFSAWLNHTDTKSLNSHDTLVEENGLTYIKHYLIDFSAAFGTDAFEPKSPRAGYVHMLDWPDAARSFFTLGLFVPKYATAGYSYIRQAGRIEANVFDPDGWKSHYYNPAFDNCLPDDGYWAAKKVMAFTDEEIRALVATAEYSSKEGNEYLARVLMQRRDKIGREYFSKVLPLDNFRVRGEILEFDDLAVVYKFESPKQYAISWSRFDNMSGTKTAVDANTSPAIPSALKSAPYIAADIHGEDPKKVVTVYLRQRSQAYEVVGIDRGW